ncbi:transposase [Croceicoccus sp. 1NDH52]|nr:transposase [Croceicoccus gelatinilyticus]
MPFFGFGAPIRGIIYTTNAIEALNSKLRQSARIRSHFLGNEAAMKLPYLVLNHAVGGMKPSSSKKITGRVAPCLGYSGHKLMHEPSSIHSRPHYLQDEKGGRLLFPLFRCGPVKDKIRSRSLHQRLLRKPQGRRRSKRCRE